MSPDAELRADARANRQAVIDAALELLPDRPEASMQEIADHSGVGRTTVYRHFPNREELFDAIATHAMEESRAAVAEMFSREGHAAETIRGVCRINIELGHRFRALYVRPTLTKPRLRTMARAEDDPLTTFLERAATKGEVRSDQPAWWLNATFLALNMAMVHEVFLGRIGPEEAGEVLGETVVSAIVADA